MDGRGCKEGLGLSKLSDEGLHLMGRRDARVSNKILLTGRSRRGVCTTWPCSILTSFWTCNSSSRRLSCQLVSVSPGFLQRSANRQTYRFSGIKLLSQLVVPHLGHPRPVQPQKHRQPAARESTTGVVDSQMTLLASLDDDDLLVSPLSYQPLTVPTILNPRPLPRVVLRRIDCWRLSSSDLLLLNELVLVLQVIVVPRMAVEPSSSTGGLPMKTDRGPVHG